MGFFDTVRSFLEGCNARSDHTNLVRTASGKLQPAPGFDWCTKTPGDFRVEWRPGKIWPERHLAAGPREGKWSPCAGYAWVRPSDPICLDVQWRPGYEDSQRHLVAGEREGDWRPEPGYAWVAPADPASLAVYWEVGRAHPRHPHVVAGSVDGVWAPAPGYRWVNGEDSADARVEPIPPEASQRGQATCEEVRDLAVLGLGIGASGVEIESAFRRLVLVHHPDRFLAQGAAAVETATQTFRVLRAAYERLTSGGRRG